MTELVRDLHVVCGKKHCCALLVVLSNNALNVVGDGRVKSGRRFVQEPDIGFVDEAAGESEAMLHAL